MQSSILRDLLRSLSPKGGELFDPLQLFKPSASSLPFAHLSPLLWLSRLSLCSGFRRSLRSFAVKSFLNLQMYSGGQPLPASNSGGSSAAVAGVDPAPSSTAIEDQELPPDLTMRHMFFENPVIEAAFRDAYYLGGFKATTITAFLSALIIIVIAFTQYKGTASYEGLLGLLCGIVSILAGVVSAVLWYRSIHRQDDHHHNADGTSPSFNTVHVEWLWFTLNLSFVVSQACAAHYRIVNVICAPGITWKPPRDPLHPCDHLIDGLQLVSLALLFIGRPRTQHVWLLTAIAVILTIVWRWFVYSIVVRDYDTFFIIGSLLLCTGLHGLEINARNRFLTFTRLKVRISETLKVKEGLYAIQREVVRQYPYKVIVAIHQHALQHPPLAATSNHNTVVSNSRRAPPLNLAYAAEHATVIRIGVTPSTSAATLGASEPAQLSHYLNKLQALRATIDTAMRASASGLPSPCRHVSLDRAFTSGDVMWWAAGLLPGGATASAATIAQRAIAAAWKASRALTDRGGGGGGGGLLSSGPVAWQVTFACASGAVIGCVPQRRSTVGGDSQPRQQDNLDYMTLDGAPVLECRSLSNAAAAEGPLMTAPAASVVATETFLALAQAGYGAAGRIEWAPVVAVATAPQPPPTAATSAGDSVVDPVAPPPPVPPTTLVRIVSLPGGGATVQPGGEDLYGPSSSMRMASPTTGGTMAAAVVALLQEQTLADWNAFVGQASNADDAHQRTFDAVNSRPPPEDVYAVGGASTMNATGGSAATGVPPPQLPVAQSTVPFANALGGTSASALGGVLPKFTRKYKYGPLSYKESGVESDFQEYSRSVFGVGVRRVLFHVALGNLAVLFGFAAELMFYDTGNSPAIFLFLILAAALPVGAVHFLNRCPVKYLHVGTAAIFASQLLIYLAAIASGPSVISSEITYVLYFYTMIVLCAGTPPFGFIFATLLNMLCILLLYLIITVSVNPRRLVPLNTIINFVAIVVLWAIPYFRHERATRKAFADEYLSVALQAQSNVQLQRGYWSLSKQLPGPCVTLLTDRYLSTTSSPPSLRISADSGSTGGGGGPPSPGVVRITDRNGGEMQEVTMSPLPAASSSSLPPRSLSSVAAFLGPPSAIDLGATVAILRVQLGQPATCGPSNQPARGGPGLGGSASSSSSSSSTTADVLAAWHSNVSARHVAIERCTMRGAAATSWDIAAPASQQRLPGVRILFRFGDEALFAACAELAKEAPVPRGAAAFSMASAASTNYAGAVTDAEASANLVTVAENILRVFDNPTSSQSNGAAPASSSTQLPPGRLVRAALDVGHVSASLVHETQRETSSHAASAALNGGSAGGQHRHLLPDFDESSASGCSLVDFVGAAVAITDCIVANEDVFRAIIMMNATLSSTTAVNAAEPQQQQQAPRAAPSLVSAVSNVVATDGFLEMLPATTRQRFSQVAAPPGAMAGDSNAENHHDAPASATFLLHGFRRSRLSALTVAARAAT